MAPDLLTSRLRLRKGREQDLTPFASMNADPRVMEFFPKTLTRTEAKPSPSAYVRSSTILPSDCGQWKLWKQVIWLQSKILISVNHRFARRAVPARQDDDASSGLLADGHAVEGGDADWT